jgi:nitrite reductase/ring-hydroxylating ferredoxin subunit
VDFHAAVAELDALVQTLEREGDERALMLLQLVDAIHRPALRLLLEGRREESIVRAVLAMYELDVTPLPVARRMPVFADAGAPLDPGELRSVPLGEGDVLLTNFDGEVYALRDACPVDGRSLAGGRLTDAVLVCPWHNCAYDVRSGKRVDDPGAPGLRVMPVTVRDGAVRVAVDAA